MRLIPPFGKRSLQPAWRSGWHSWHLVRFFQQPGSPGVPGLSTWGGLQSGSPRK